MLNAQIFYVGFLVNTIFFIGDLGGDTTSTWQRLLNGKNLSGWSTSGNWKVKENQVLSIKPRVGEHGWQRYADYLWTDKQYSNFALRLEYKIPIKGNSGVFLGVKNKTNPVYEGIEIQILDSYGKKEPLTAHDAGGIIGIAPPRKNMARPAGKWNQLEIICRKDHLVVDLNGEKIIDLDLTGKTGRSHPLTGFIGLQDHGVPLEFRNIEIKSF
ncbi:MAG: DUF1080 domain-containing protein [Pirellulales bacterium]|nr:DUF1080 domain-containing protein [Pirellulales bacterium]